MRQSVGRGKFCCCLILGEGIFTMATELHQPSCHSRSYATSRYLHRDVAFSPAPSRFRPHNSSFIVVLRRIAADTPPLTYPLLFHRTAFLELCRPHKRVWVSIVFVCNYSIGLRCTSTTASTQTLYLTQGTHRLPPCAREKDGGTYVCRRLENLKPFRPITVFGARRYKTMHRDEATHRKVDDADMYVTEHLCRGEEEAQENRCENERLTPDHN